jgi:hypothetical protein
MDLPGFFPGVPGFLPGFLPVRSVGKRPASGTVCSIAVVVLPSL